MSFLTTPSLTHNFVYLPTVTLFHPQWPVWQAVAAGVSFRDDLVSALVEPSDGIGGSYCSSGGVGAGADTSRNGCESRQLSNGPTSVTNGNLLAAVGPDGKLTFTRVSDSKVLLKEQFVR
jgi:hypothetical protein